MLLNVAFYLSLGYMPAYMSGRLEHSTAQGNWMLVAVMAMMLLAILPVVDGTDRQSEDALQPRESRGDLPRWLVPEILGYLFHFLGRGARTGS